MSYESVKQKILNSLVNRPAGTQIQPTKQQEYELDFLEYVKSLESISNSAFIGFAEANTIPIQPNDANVFYVSLINHNTTNNYNNFRNSLGNVISLSADSNTVFSFVILNWNKVYWSGQKIDIPATYLATKTYVDSSIDLAIVLGLE